jgi:hypothetical protein
LYDLKTGQLKNTITSGEWLVRKVLQFDTERRELWIQTAGRVKGRSPYLQDICRVNIDSGELTTVVSTDHEYFTLDQKSKMSVLDKTSLSVSTTGRYVVTTRSRVDEVPVSLLLDSLGRELLVLETADTSALPSHWQWPEPVKTRAADGKSDIYGIVYRPSNFSPEKSYPVLDYSFVTYEEPSGAFGFLNLEAMAYAELGFVVVKFFNRAILGVRELSFRENKDHTRPFVSMADNVAGIQQLASEHAYIDASKVGAATHSTMPTALATLIYPDFYTVGVSVNTMTDARLLGGMGVDFGGADFPPYEDFAENLTGKLLLIAGMMDPTIPVAGTFRLIEALQKANKSFDQLLLPNFGHEFSAYVTRRTWDYFVEHLQGVNPPDNFGLTLQSTNYTYEFYRCF